MTPRLILTIVAVIGTFVLAALGVVEGDTALAFVAGALAVPSVGDVTADAIERRRYTRGE